MFTRIRTINKKEQILISFKSAESPLRLIIATIAFGLGIDCRDIEKIIHWGIPSNVVEYVCARDGEGGARRELGNRWWYSMKGEGEDMLGKKLKIILQTKLSVEEKFFLRIF